MCQRTDILSYLQADLSFIKPADRIAYYRAESIRKSLVKKWLPDSGDKTLDDKALTLFIACNEKCGNYKLPECDLGRTLLGEVQYFFDKIFYESDQSPTIDLTAISRGFGVGPGASIGSEDDSFYTKLFSSPLTHTNSALPVFYREAIKESPRWKSAESFRSAHHGERLVVASNLSFVPKTLEVSRTICTEPVLNMLFQKGIGLVLERLLKRHFSIDLSTQPDINRELAHMGSLSGRFGTIDLSSASDSISLTLLRQLLPRQVMTWIERSRSPATRLPDRTVLNLNMVSSMGNGFTFPLQTLIFTALVRAVYKIEGIPLSRNSGKRLPNFGVFGDDIIVDTRVYDKVVTGLTLFGFSVNEAKSFNTGSFRESCGGDYVDGHDVRGVYIRSLATYQDVYSAFNRLTRWSSKSGIPLAGTLQYLLDSLPLALRLPVPPVEGDTMGLVMSQEKACHLFKVTRKGALRTCTPDLRPFWEQKALIRYAVLCDERVSKRVQGSKLWYGSPLNEEGLIISFVGGYIRGGSISLRAVRPKPRVALRRAKFWYDVDAIPPEAAIVHPRAWLARGAALRGDYTWESIVDLRLTTVEP